MSTGYACLLIICHLPSVIRHPPPSRPPRPRKHFPPMRLLQIDLKLVRLPLIRPFRTSSSVKDHLAHILVRVESDDGHVGWGESASPSDPYYCPETTETCWHILRDFLGPLVLGKEWRVNRRVLASLSTGQGQQLRQGRPGDGLLRPRSPAPRASRCRRFLGGVRPRIASGVSLGIERDRGTLLDLIAQYLDEGYRRIKLKIGPGDDVDLVEAVRRVYPEVRSRSTPTRPTRSTTPTGSAPSTSSACC